MSEIKIFNSRTLEMYVDRRNEGLTKEGFEIGQQEVVPENDPRLNPANWNLGQTGMVGKIIKPIDQTGVEKGQVRIIIAPNVTSEDNE